ncbi:DUF5916 domain-containing protein [Candidatus Latescibacterota bacterium]
MKTFLFMTALLFLTIPNMVFSDQGIAAKAGDEPYRVPIVETPVKVDAILDEDVWQKAIKIDANIEVSPGENIQAPVKTEVLLAYSETHLYAAFRAYDPNPSEILAYFTDRDNFYDDDWVGLILDTFNDQRRSYEFFCNPFGVQGDKIDGRSAWDAIWDSHGRITDDGYIVEMAIPFSTLRFPGGGDEQIWGFDIERNYPRNVQHEIGAFPRDRNNSCYMCQFLKMIGFAGAVPGKDIEIDPTFSGGTTQERADGTSGPFRMKDRKTDTGITARWRFTPNMTLSATANPDFSQVEADVAQMEINTRFPLYYSEKRPFFLEGAEIFRNQFSLVHTRTLAEPDWGVKLTGKEGKHSMGFFSVRDNVTPLIFPHYEGASNTTLSMQSTGTVLRYKYDVGKSSNVGAVLTDREGDEYHNRVVGIDGSFDFTPKDSFSFGAVYSNTSYPEDIVSEYDQPGSDFGGTGYSMQYSHDTEKYSVWCSYYEMNPDFRTDLGFETQVGFNYSNIGGQYMWRKGPDHWYNWISIFFSYYISRDHYFNLMHKAYTSQFYYRGPLQSYFSIYGEYGRDPYKGKDFRANFLSSYVGFKPSGSCDLYLRCTTGDKIDYSNRRAGKKLSLSPSIDQKIGRHLTLSADHRFERLKVDPGRLYDANVSNFGGVYQFNRRTFLRINLQYVDYDRTIENYLYDVDANTTTMFSQILFSYKINPQTVFFLGYSDNYRNRNYLDERGEFDDSLTQTNRTLFTKIGYAWLL